MPCIVNGIATPNSKCRGPSAVCSTPPTKAPVRESGTKQRLSNEI